MKFRAFFGIREVSLTSADKIVRTYSFCRPGNGLNIPCRMQPDLLSPGSFQETTVADGGHFLISFPVRYRLRFTSASRELPIVRKKTSHGSARNSLSPRVTEVDLIGLTAMPMLYQEVHEP